MADNKVDPFAFMLEEMKNEKPVELADRESPFWHSHWCSYLGEGNCPDCIEEWNQCVEIDRAHKKKYGMMKRNCFQGCSKCNC
jgi:hypothetical protein